MYVIISFVNMSRQNTDDCGIVACWFQQSSKPNRVKQHGRAHDLGDPIEQVLSEFQDTVKDKIGRIEAQLEDALKSKEKVIFFSC